MATATLDTVKKTVETTVNEEVIQLTLTKAEARALWALTSFVYSGDDDTTYARETNAVRQALLASRKLGYAWKSDFFYVDEDGDIRAKSHAQSDK